MSTAGEFRAVTWLGLRSIPARIGTSMVIVVGVAAVVAVLISALSIATGFRRVAATTGSNSFLVSIS